MTKVIRRCQTTFPARKTRSTAGSPHLCSSDKSISVFPVSGAHSSALLKSYCAWIILESCGLHTGIIHCQTRHQIAFNNIMSFPPSRMRSFQYPQKKPQLYLIKRADSLGIYLWKNKHKRLYGLVIIPSHHNRIKRENEKRRINCRIEPDEPVVLVAG